MILPKISVVIPCHNSEKTLPECLNSALNQSYENYEVIVVDNNSDDKTKEIIKKFQKKSKKVRYFFEGRIGRGVARNLGERNSSGEIVLMTDSDCILPENWIEKISEPIRKGKAVAVQGIKKPVVKNYWTLQMEEEEKRNIQKRLSDKKIGLLDTANFAIRKDVLEKIGYSNPKIFRGNDTELEIRLREKGFEILFRKILVKHYHSDSFIKIIKKFFEGGRGSRKLRKMYSNRQTFESINNLKFLAGLIGDLLKFERRLFYDFVSGVAWRIGFYL